MFIYLCAHIHMHTCMCICNNNKKDKRAFNLRVGEHKKSEEGKLGGIGRKKTEIKRIYSLKKYIHLVKQ